MSAETLKALDKDTDPYVTKQHGDAGVFSFSDNPKMMYQAINGGNVIDPHGIIRSTAAAKSEREKDKLRHFCQSFAASTGLYTLHSPLAAALKAAANFIKIHLDGAEKDILDTSEQIGFLEAQLAEIEGEYGETQLLLMEGEQALVRAEDRLEDAAADYKDAQLMYEDAQMLMDGALEEYQKQGEKYVKEYKKLIKDPNGNIVFRNEDSWLQRYYIEAENGEAQPLGYAGQIKSLTLDFCFRTTGDDIAEREKKLGHAERRAEHFSGLHEEAEEQFTRASRTYAERTSEVEDIRNFVGENRKELELALREMKEQGANVEQLKERLGLLTDKFTALAKLRAELKDPDIQTKLRAGDITINDLAKDLPPTLREEFMRQQNEVQENSKVTVSVAKELDNENAIAPSNSLCSAFKGTMEKTVVPAAKKVFDMVTQPIQQPVYREPAPALVA